jgi:5-formaminoimidazole-4-carboxamide-1-beta-D-ribofuranosyl 5'-monophosphate synthetase
MLIQPSEFEFHRISSAIIASAPGEYDMEIINKLYRGNALVIPHRSYGLLSGELWKKVRSQYLGNSEEKWDPEKALREAKVVHFSDWPVPKVTKSQDPQDCRKDTEASSSLGFTIQKSP